MRRRVDGGAGGPLIGRARSVLEALRVPSRAVIQRPPIPEVRDRIRDGPRDPLLRFGRLERDEIRAPWIANRGADAAEHVRMLEQLESKGPRSVVVETWPPAPCYRDCETGNQI